MTAIQLHPKTIEFLKHRNIEPFDLSINSDVLKLDSGYRYDFNGIINGRHIHRSFSLCKCGLLHQGEIRECPVCRNDKFKRMVNKKMKDADVGMSLEEAIAQKCKTLQYNRDFYLVMDEKERQVSFIKERIAYHFDFVKKGIHVEDVSRMEKTFRYMDGLWHQLCPETNEPMPVQSFAGLTICMLSTFGNMMNTDSQGPYIREFLPFYNAIVPKEECIHYYEGINFRNIAIMLLSRNQHVLNEFFQRNLDDAGLYRYQHNQFSPIHEGIFNINVLNDQFPEVALKDYHLEEKERQLNLFFSGCSNIYAGERFEDGKHQHQNIYKIIPLPKSILWKLKEQLIFHDLYMKKKFTINKLFDFFNVLLEGLHRYRIPPEVMVEMLDIAGLDIKLYRHAYSLIEKHPTKKPTKIAGYLKKIAEAHKMTVENAYAYYRDYIRLSESLMLDITLFPKNLLKVHDIRVREINLMKEEKLTVRFDHIYGEYEEVMDINKDYVMMKPLTTRDLMKEGQALHHCVASYAEAVIHKHSLIFFLRKKNQVEKSLVTVEVNPKNMKVVQRKGNYNRGITKEESHAIDAWYQKYIEQPVQ